MFGDETRQRNHLVVTLADDCQPRVGRKRFGKEAPELSPESPVLRPLYAGAPARDERVGCLFVERGVRVEQFADLVDRAPHLFVRVCGVGAHATQLAQQLLPAGLAHVSPSIVAMWAGSPTRSGESARR